MVCVCWYPPTLIVLRRSVNCTTVELLFLDLAWLPPLFSSANLSSSRGCLRRPTIVPHYNCSTLSAVRTEVVVADWDCWVVIISLVLPDFNALKVKFTHFPWVMRNFEKAPWVVDRANCRLHFAFYFYFFAQSRWWEFFCTNSKHSQCYHNSFLSLVIHGINLSILNQLA